MLRKVVVGDLGKQGPVGSTGESAVDSGSLRYIEQQLTFTVVVRWPPDMSAHVIQTASTWNKRALEALATRESFAQASSALRGPACD